MYLSPHIHIYIHICTRITPLFPSESSRLVRSTLNGIVLRLSVNVVIATIEPFALIVRRDLRELRVYALIYGLTIAPWILN